MVYFRTTGELNAAYQHMVGVYDASDTAHRPDTTLALQMAALKPGESVLELGTASGRLVASAKQAVGAGVCVGVDAVQGFLDVDLPFTLAGKGLTVYPAGTATQQVHRLRANVTETSLVDRIRALPGTPQTYDCIFAVHIFTTVPPQERLSVLRSMRRLLSPAGRIIMNMSARFVNTPPPAAQADTPEQFRTAPAYTEAPGSLLLMGHAHQALPVARPQGPPTSPKVPLSITQLSPDRFWVLARQQAAHAAERAGFAVTASRDIGKGDLFNLPRGGRSPPPSQLDSMPLASIPVTMNAIVAPLGAYHCSGRAWDTLNRRSPVWGSLTVAERNHSLTLGLQRIEENETRRIRDAQLLGVQQAMEAAQVGVLVCMKAL